MNIKKLSFCKHIIKALSLCVFACFIGVANFSNAEDGDWANLKAYAAKNSELLAMGNVRHRVVFMGDSITEFWDKDKANIFADPKFVNRGISGQTTPQMLLRFRQDVIALKPEVVVILGGTNDIAGNNGPVTNEMIQDNIMSMVELARANRIKVVLCAIVPAGKYYWAPNIKPIPRISAINAWMRQYARAQNLEFIDYYSPMVDAEGGLKGEYTNDGVHPNSNGYIVMAQLVRTKLSRIIRN